MKRIVELKALDTRSAAGQAMGDAPGWQMLLDPSSRQGADGFLNGASRNDLLTTGNWPLGSDNDATFDNGEAAYRVTSGFTSSTGFGRRLKTTFALNPTEWTFFFVVAMDITPSVGAFSFIQPETVTGGGLGIGLRVIMATNGRLRVLETSSNNIRLEAPSNTFPDDVPHLIMVTFSTRDGLRVYKDGQLYLSDPDDKRPLDDQTGPGEYYLMSNRTESVDDVRVGMMGLLSADLSWPEHAEERLKIEEFLIDKYGIAE